MRLVESYGDSAPPSISWEECACLHCGSANHTPLFEAADSLGAGLRFLVVRCNSCGLCFTNPRPDTATIQHFYPPDYHCHRVKEYATKERFWRADPMRKLLPMHGQARLLDFGCGACSFLRRMRALGWDVTGLDSANAVVEHMDDLRIHVGTLPNPRWSDASFEAITMWQSLEHVHQPLDVLCDAYRLLTNGGRLLVAVPNFESFGAHTFGPHWYGLDVPRHLTHFTSDTLTSMLRKAGFDRLDVWQHQHTSWIRHSAERAGGGILGARAGSRLAGWWGSLTGRAESLLAIAVK